MLLRKPCRKTISGSRSPFFTPAGSVSVVLSGVPSKLSTIPVQIVCASCVSHESRKPACAGAAASSEHERR